MGGSRKSDSGSDSDFYGKPKTVARLNQRARLPRVRYSRKTKEDAPPHRRPAVIKNIQPQQQLNNPFAGVPYAWQIGESVDEFMGRLPPTQIEATGHIPCIYICNPHVRRKKKSECESQLIPGCGDEGPEAETGVHTALFVTGAKERLGILTDFLDGLKKMTLPQAAASRDAQSARQSAARDILELAGNLGVTCGKWMLFVDPDKVDGAWNAVALATYQGKLGIAAKIVTRRPAAEGWGSSLHNRLICVYTSDFREPVDTGRVLLQLEALGLVKRHGGPTAYYKCDAYTYLGIGAINPWGLRASLLSSGDVFARLDHAKNTWPLELQ